MKNIFATVKEAVTTRQAAEHYGLKVSRNGMTCCIFHNDRNPSMKVDERYYCFSCHATGDVINFTARLFNLKPYQAAQKLVQDFLIDPNSPAPAAALPAWQQQARQRDIVSHCIQVLVETECLMKQWKEQYVPTAEDEDWDAHFTEACNTLPVIGHYLDLLYSADEEMRNKTANALIRTKTISRLETILKNGKPNAAVDAAEKDNAA